MIISIKYSQVIKFMHEFTSSRRFIGQLLLSYQLFLHALHPQRGVHRSFSSSFSPQLYLLKKKKRLTITTLATSGIEYKIIKNMKFRNLAQLLTCDYRRIKCSFMSVRIVCNFKNNKKKMDFLTNRCWRCGISRGSYDLSDKKNADSREIFIMTNDLSSVVDEKYGRSKLLTELPEVLTNFIGNIACRSRDWMLLRKRKILDCFLMIIICR